MDTTEKDRLMGQAYSAATTELRTAHKDEFNGYYQKQLASRGIDWTPKKSKQELALEQILTLLQENPELSAALAARLAPDHVPD
jgi:hypothetical protein